MQRGSSRTVPSAGPSSDGPEFGGEVGKPLALPGGVSAPGARTDKHVIMREVP
jgi:hypothetical protein